MKRVWIAFLLVLLCAGTALAQAPPTILIMQNDKFAWTASPDEGATFGEPPMQLVTGYQLLFYKKADVDITGTTAAPLFAPKPTAVPALTFDNVGHTQPDATMTEVTTSTVKTFIGSNLNVEYVAFVKAVGSGGASPISNGAGPFGILGPPRAPVAFRRIP